MAHAVPLYCSMSGAADTAPTPAQQSIAVAHATPLVRCAM
jgi:hypothetical protein